MFALIKGEGRAESSGVPARVDARNMGAPLVHPSLAIVPVSAPLLSINGVRSVIGSVPRGLVSCFDVETIDSGSGAAGKCMCQGNVPELALDIGDEDELCKSRETGRVGPRRVRSFSRNRTSAEMITSGKYNRVYTPR